MQLLVLFPVGSGPPKRGAAEHQHLQMASKRARPAGPIHLLGLSWEGSLALGSNFNTLIFHKSGGGSFPWFSFLRKQLNKNLRAETWQKEAFTHIFVICVHLLEDSADLDSIEAVANEVLNMEMPSTPQQLQALTEDIRERVESLSDVEVILQQSAGDIARAEMLLEEAKKARYAALFHLIVSENAV